MILIMDSRAGTPPHTWVSPGSIARMPLVVSFRNYLDDMTCIIAIYNAPFLGGVGWFSVCSVVKVGIHLIILFIY